MKPKVLCVIGARGGSKRVPNKNLRLLAGRPLMAYTIQAAKASNAIDRIVLSTEDERIAQVGRDLGVEVPFLRPPELASDDAKLPPVTKHAMEFMDRAGFRADIVVQLQPVCPFVPPEKITESIEKVASGRASSAVSLRKVTSGHPYRMKVIVDPKDGIFRNFITDIDVDTFQSSYHLPEVYCSTGAIYTRRRDLLDNYNGKDFALGNRPVAVVLDEIEAMDIDYPLDFEIAEHLMARRLYLKKEFQPSSAT